MENISLFNHFNLESPKLASTKAAFFDKRRSSFSSESKPLKALFTRVDRASRANKHFPEYRSALTFTEPRPSVPNAKTLPYRLSDKVKIIVYKDKDCL